MFRFGGSFVSREEKKRCNYSSVSIFNLVSSLFFSICLLFELRGASQSRRRILKVEVVTALDDGCGTTGGGSARGGKSNFAPPRRSRRDACERATRRDERVIPRRPTGALRKYDNR